MTLDDYKELMRFHLLLSNEDLTGYNYAATDQDGQLYVYGKKPQIVMQSSNYNSSLWTPHEEIKDIDTLGSVFLVIETMPKHPQWDQTLIKL